MNGKSLAWICIALVAVALIVAPVSADGTTTGSAAVIGNPTSYVSMSLNLTELVMGTNGIMDPETTETNTSLGITVSANKAFTISVADNTATERDSTRRGFMSNYTGTAYETHASGLDTVLDSPLELDGAPTTSTTTNVTISAPITTAVSLYQGSGAVTSQLLAPNKFSQPVASTDVVQPDGSTYRCDLIFTIAAS